MNFSFWPFLWFGLPGRLLILLQAIQFNVNRACFPKEKHQNSQRWAKFMNFSFWPFLWFGLPGRLLIIDISLPCKAVSYLHSVLTKWGWRWGVLGLVRPQTKYRLTWVLFPSQSSIVLVKCVHSIEDIFRYEHLPFPQVIFKKAWKYPWQ